MLYKSWKNKKLSLTRKLAQSRAVVFFTPITCWSPSTISYKTWSFDLKTSQWIPITTIATPHANREIDNNVLLQQKDFFADELNSDVIFMERVRNIEWSCLICCEIASDLLSFLINNIKTQFVYGVHFDAKFFAANLFRALSPALAKILFCRLRSSEFDANFIAVLSPVQFDANFISVSSFCRPRRWKWVHSFVLECSKPFI